MLIDARAIEAVIGAHLGRTFPAASLVVRIAGAETYARAFGFLDPESNQRPAQLDTRFDLASVSKLFTVTAFMTLVEAGHFRLDQPVCEALSEFEGLRPIRPYPDPLRAGQVVSVSADDGEVDAAQVTFRHLLAHNSGLPAWLPLYRQGSRERAYQEALHCAFSYPTGARVIYSDIGLILLGLAIERRLGQRLDEVVAERVCAPLNLASVAYNPPDPRNIAPTEVCQWRQRRLIGEVHDENAGGMDGVAGHAGLFGAARDVAALGEMYWRGGAPLLAERTVAEMTRLQSEWGGARRGLGFALWSPDLDASSNPLSTRTFGHTGFTGTSLWVDPARELVVACLTNRVYYGRDNADAMARFRVILNQAIAGAVGGSL
ncbi:MAG: beta-lactamase family protein [Chloroflexi bacterium]|nr:beta-lactamase family protein [Chloroflexota bacterium]